MNLIAFDDYEVADLLTDVMYYLTIREAYNLSLISKKHNNQIFNISHLTTNHRTPIVSFNRLFSLRATSDKSIMKMDNLLSLRKLRTNDFELRNETITKLTNLTTLDLCAIYVTDISSLTNLTELNIRNNREIISISSLTNLTRLKMRDNCIPINLSCLTKLEKLDISIGQLSASFTGMNSLINLKNLVLKNKGCLKGITLPSKDLSSALGNNIFVTLNPFFPW